MNAVRRLARSLLKAVLMSKPIPSISKYMTTTPHTIEGTVTLAAAEKLMQDHGIRHLPVMSGAKLLGIITERDIRYVASFSIVDPAQATVSGAMSEDLYAVSPETPLDQVVGTMAEKKYGSAVVVQNERVVGVFTTVDACRALSELLSTRLRG
jgi:acetoin utilization protein AcuB